MQSSRRASLALALAATSTLAFPSCSLLRLGGGEEEEIIATEETPTDLAEAADARAQEARDAAREQEPVVRGAITKIKPFHLQPDKDYSAADPAIPFEAQYYLYGAITSEERLARYGHYYTIFWSPEDRTAPVDILFEYRQRETGSEVAAIRLTEENPRKKNQTKIQLTGDEYFTKGSITSWRITLRQNGEVIGQDRSFLWQ